MKAEKRKDEVTLGELEWKRRWAVVKRKKKIGREGQKGAIKRQKGV